MAPTEEQMKAARELQEMFRSGGSSGRGGRSGHGGRSGRSGPSGGPRLPSSQSGSTKFGTTSIRRSQTIVPMHHAVPAQETFQVDKTLVDRYKLPPSMAGWVSGGGDSVRETSENTTSTSYQPSAASTQGTTGPSPAQPVKAPMDSNDTTGCNPRLSSNNPTQHNNITAGTSPTSNGIGDSAAAMQSTMNGGALSNGTQVGNGVGTGDEAASEREMMSTENVSEGSDNSSSPLILTPTQMYHLICQGWIPPIDRDAVKKEDLMELDGEGNSGGGGTAANAPHLDEDVPMGLPDPIQPIQGVAPQDEDDLMSFPGKDSNSSEAGNSGGRGGLASSMWANAPDGSGTGSLYHVNDDLLNPHAQSFSPRPTTTFKRPISKAQDIKPEDNPYLVDGEYLKMDGPGLDKSRWA